VSEDFAPDDLDSGPVDATRPRPRWFARSPRGESIRFKSKARDGATEVWVAEDGSLWRPLRNFVGRVEPHQGRAS